MPNLVLIVEGHGDVGAFPNLVGKVGAWLQSPLYIKNPIRSKGWGSIKKAGGLEKWVGLAVSRDECERVVIVVDLDDGCPVAEKESIADRIQALRALHGVDIDLCFCLREFEAWLLRCLDSVEGVTLPDNEIQQIIANADTFRDAKGKLRSSLKDGYSESADQPELISAIICPTLYNRDRSFRKFVKAISGLDYEILEVA